MTTARRHQRLGRGLSALLGDDEQNPSSFTAGNPELPFRVLPIETIEAGPFQPRNSIDPEQLEDLAASIRANGLLQPILVRPKANVPNRFEIVGGERRWRAAQLAQCHEIPVLIRTMSDREAMAAALVENLQRQDLNALEEAQGYRRLVDEFGLTQEALGQSLGKSRSHIANTLRLLNLPEPVRAMVASGSLSAGHARALLTAPDAARLARQVVADGLNVRQTETLVAAKPTRAQRPPRPAREASLDDLERELSAHLGLRVGVRNRGDGRGEVSIEFRDLEQLEGVVRLLRG